MEVRIEAVAKEFDRCPALHEVSLDIPSGELAALVGPSGSGKTTLLRLIAGLEMPGRGRILFGEEDASRLTVQARRVGFVFQHYALFRHMTVLENVGFGLSARPRALRPARAEIDRRARELLELVQLDRRVHGRHSPIMSGVDRRSDVTYAYDVRATFRATSDRTAFGRCAILPFSSSHIKDQRGAAYPQAIAASHQQTPPWTISRHSSRRSGPSWTTSPPSRRPR